jgi:phosphoglycerate dehydrogenase-like enzyme
VKNPQVSTAAVVFADGFFMDDADLAEIAQLGGYAWAHARDDVDLAQKIGGSLAVRVIVSDYIRVNSLVFEKAPGLKGIIAYGAGYDHIDVREAARRGIQVCNCRGENAQAVAELTFGLLLALARKIHCADSYIRAGRWKRAESSSLPLWCTGRELWKKTLGIIGLGQIGSRVARIAQGFEMRGLAYDPWRDADNLPGVQRMPLESLLSESDIVTLHVPLTPQTEKMIDATNFSRMKRGVLLVNTSRGRVIEERALIDALKTGRIAGAALDVFEEEPISKEHPLSQLPNVILSPHMGAMTQEAGLRLSRAVTRQVEDLLAGRKPECLIEP